MTKDLKIAVFFLLISFPCVLFLTHSIYDLEYPKSLLTHSLETGQHNYLIGNGNSTIKFNLDLQDQINKTLFLKAETVFDSHNIDVKLQFTFNPLGQLFKSALNFEVDSEQKFTCELTGTKLIRITCIKANKESPVTIELPGPINISKRPDNKYLLSFQSLDHNDLIKNLYIFLENMDVLNQNETKEIKLNLNLSSYPLLQTELTTLTNDISK